MSELAVTIIYTITIICVVIFVLSIRKKEKNHVDTDEDDLSEVDEDEQLLLSTIDDDYHDDVLIYVRTLKMTSRLSKYISDKKNILDALSYFVMIKFSQKISDNKQVAKSLKNEYTNDYIKQQIKRSVSFWSKNGE